MTKAKHIGDPGYRSPKTVSNDPTYRDATSLARREFETWPSSSFVVVEHIATGTYWMATFGITDDDSDYEFQASWSQVEPVEKVTAYWKKLP